MVLRGRAAVLGLVLGAGAMAGGACSGNHSGLGVDDGTTGAGGATTATSGTGTTSSTTATMTTGAGGAGGEPFDAGPSGPTKLTIVNGVNDYAAIRLCFLPYPAGDPAAVPWPADPAGLGFARTVVVDPIADVIPLGSDVRPTLLAGDLSLTAGKTCAEILASGGGAGGAGGGAPASPPLAIVDLPVLPASVWDSGKSLLLVPYGCVGAPDHTSPSQQLACGMTYSPATPTLGVVVLGMSRITDPDAIALQVAHASAALPTVDVKITPAPDAVELPIAKSLAVGGAAPVPPFTAVSELTLPQPADAVLKTYYPNDTYPTSAIPLSDAFSHGDLGASDLADGKGFALVAVGGFPGVAAESWWHAMTYVLVRTDP